MQPDDQRFLDTVSSYDYFRRGAMDVEEHCCWLALAFKLDQVDPAPQPGEIFNLLTAIVEESSRHCGCPLLQRKQLARNSGYDEGIHPGGQLTLLHPATAIMVFDAYLFALGSLVGKEPPHHGAQVGFWIEPSWLFVSAVVEGLHRCVSELMFRLDRGLRQEKGYSALEAMRLSSLQPGADADAILGAHARGVRELHRRMKNAIECCAFAEAVTLQEKILTNLLGHSIEIHGRRVPDTLLELINVARELALSSGETAPLGLWDRAHAWRRGRNRVVHGHRSSVFEVPVEMDESQAQETAQSGLHLIAEVWAWCVDARGRSMNMSIPKPAGSVVRH